MTGNGFLRFIRFAGYGLLFWGLVKLARTDGLRPPLIWTLSGTVTVLTCTNLSHSSRTKELEESVEQLKDNFNRSLESYDRNFHILNQNDSGFDSLLAQQNSKLTQLNSALSQVQSGLANQLSLLDNNAVLPPVAEPSINEETINLKLQQLESRIIAERSQYIELIDSIIAQYHKHILVSDRNESHNFLLKVLGGEPQIKNCNQFEEIKPPQKYLIMVCPWLSKYVFGTIDERSYVSTLIENLLKQGVEIHIGYGYLNHIHKNDRNSVNAANYLELVQKNKDSLNMHLGLEPLTKLSQQYSNLKLRFICSHEKYLVSDGKLAVFGSHNFLSSVPQKYAVDRESAILTCDPTIIELLTQRYSNTEELSRRNSRPKPILRRSANS